MRKAISIMMVLALLLSAGVCGFAEDAAATEADREALAYLGGELAAPAAMLMQQGEDVADIYSEILWDSAADTFPEKFDLRDRGVVTPVRSQSPWGTCWSFATMGASEASILSAMKLTAEEYAEQNGEEMDLSEKHLAWFSAMALPEADAFPEGEYPYDISQAGEGAYGVPDFEDSVYNFGGNYFLSTSSLSSGIGVLKESLAPYGDSEGARDPEGDWSLPEELRFKQSFELKNANALPAPAGTDADGNYLYRPEGTEAIKSELLKGRAVGISFCADSAMPDEPEAKKGRLLSRFGDRSNVTPEEIEAYVDFRVGITDAESVSDEQMQTLVDIAARLFDCEGNPYADAGLTREQTITALKSPYFGDAFDVLEEKEAADAARIPYLSFSGEKGEIYAHYTYEQALANHGVVVVGWDDSFPASAFREGYQPPADGAWIVKNSWDTDWGKDGYFWISYYDQSLGAIRSFEFVVDEENLQMDSLSLLEYDFMPAQIMSSTLFESPVYAANVFTVEADSVLQYVSTMTGDLNTSVTVSVYLLGDGAAEPTDGRLLHSVTQEFPFAGYHRLELGEKLSLQKGAHIGVVILQRVPTAGGMKFALTNTSSLGEKAPEAYAERHAEDGGMLARYCRAVVNPGESFVSFGEGRWLDWTQVIDSFEDDGDCVYMAYDNLPIKAYLYPLEQVRSLHRLDEEQELAFGETAVCPDCGYILMECR